MPCFSVVLFGLGWVALRCVALRWVGLGWVGVGVGVGGWGRFGSVVCFMSFTFHFLQEFFHPEELMQMVVGCQDYDFRDLEEV